MTQGVEKDHPSSSSFFTFFLIANGFLFGAVWLHKLSNMSAKFAIVVKAIVLAAATLISDYFRATPKDSEVPKDMCNTM